MNISSEVLLICILSIFFLFGANVFAVGYFVLSIVRFEALENIFPYLHVEIDWDLVGEAGVHLA